MTPDEMELAERCHTDVCPHVQAPAPISSETGAVSAIADHSSGESVPSTPDGATRPPDIHPTVEAVGAADAVYRDQKGEELLEPDGGPVDAFALALDIDSWDDAVDLAERSVPNLRSIGWALVDVNTIARALLNEAFLTDLWSNDMLINETVRDAYRSRARRLMGIEQ